MATIFVNPRQFGDPADLARYPRSEARDVAICTEEGVDLVWAPPVEEVYHAGFDTVVSVGAISRPLEGAARPGHFDGVATVVAILFGLIGAEHAYFGQKDAQQVMVIRRMALDLALPTQVIACPTVREPDGLALSSRNVHLAPDAAGRGTRAPPGTARGARRLGEPASGRRTRCAPRCATSWPTEPLASRGLRLGRRRRDAPRAGPGRRSGAAVAGGLVRERPVSSTTSCSAAG